MNKKEKILIIILVVVLIVFVFITYYQTIIKKNFEVINIEPESDNINIE